MKVFSWIKRPSIILGIILFFLSSLGGLLFLKKDSSFHPITEYHLLSSIKEINQSEVDEVMKGYLGYSFWKVDLNKIRSELIKLDWIYTAKVKRQWPGSLLISIQEQKPVVLWGESALLNRFGDVFYPKDIQLFQHLVTLHGSQQNSRELLEKLSKLQEQFLVLNWNIKRLTEQVDGVWKIEFVQAPTVLLGQKYWKDKLNRFIVVYPLMSSEIRKTAQQIDLRYSNGLVIKKKSNENSVEVLNNMSLS